MGKWIWKNDGCMTSERMPVKPEIRVIFQPDNGPIKRNGSRKWLHGRILSYDYMPYDYMSAYDIYGDDGQIYRSVCDEDVLLEGAQYRVAAEEEKKRERLTTVRYIVATLAALLAGLLLSETVSAFSEGYSDPPASYERRYCFYLGFASGLWALGLSCGSASLFMWEKNKRASIVLDILLIICFAFSFALEGLFSIHQH